MYYKTSFIERISIFLFLSSFCMPYLRIGQQGIIFPKQYILNPTNVPHIFEVILIFNFLLLIIYKKININSFVKNFHEDKTFRLILMISFYICIFYPLIKNFSPINAPTANGIIRLTVIFPLIAYFVGYNFIVDKKYIKLIFLIIILIGILMDIAILKPLWFTEYLIYYSGVTIGGSRPSGFYNLSTQAATFLLIVFCFQFVVLFNIKAKKIKIILLCLGIFNLIALFKTLQRLQIATFFLLIVFIMLSRIKKINRNSSSRKELKMLIIMIIILSLIAFSIFAYMLLPFVINRRMGIMNREISFLEDFRFKVVWPAYINFILREPFVLIFGAGLGSDALNEYRFPMHLAHAHNQFLSYIAGIGLFMSIVLFYIFFRIYNKSKICKLSDYLSYHEKMIASLCVLVLFVIAIISLGESPLFQAPISILVFFIFGIISYLYKKHMNKKYSV